MTTKIFPESAFRIAYNDAASICNHVEVGSTRTENGEACCVWGYDPNGVALKYIVCDIAYANCSYFERAF